MWAVSSLPAYRPGVPQFPSQGTRTQGCPAFPREAPTMLVGRIDICSKVQEALQAGQALWLFAGQVQGAALMDLSQESRARLA